MSMIRTIHRLPIISVSIYKRAQSDGPLNLLQICTRFGILQGMLDPADESFSIHLEHVVHLPDTLRRECLLVHMDISIAGAAI